MSFNPIQVLQLTNDRETVDFGLGAAASVIAMIDARGRRLLVPIRTSRRLAAKSTTGPFLSAIDDRQVVSGTIH